MEMNKFELHLIDESYLRYLEEEAESDDDYLDDRANDAYIDIYGFVTYVGNRQYLAGIEDWESSNPCIIIANSAQEAVKKYVESILSESDYDDLEIRLDDIELDKPQELDLEQFGFEILE